MSDNNNRLPAGSRKREVRGRKRVLREISPKGGLTRRQAEALAEEADQIPGPAMAGELRRTLIADGGAMFSAGSLQEGDPSMNSPVYIHTRAVTERIHPLNNDGQNFIV